MAAGGRYFVFLLAIFSLPLVCCLPEPGIKDLHFNKNLTYDSFSKTMNKGYTISIKGKCSGANKVQINWRLVVSQCAERFSFSKNIINDEALKGLWDYYANHSLTGIQEVVCKPVIHLPDLSDTVKELILPPAEYSIAGDDNSNEDADSKELKATKKDNKNTGSEEEEETAAESQPSNAEKTNAKTLASNQVCVTKRDGVFMLIVNAYPTEEEDNKFDLTLNVKMKGPHGYLSASEWPFYLFHGFMLLLYVFYGVVWLIASACQWRDLLRIQIWIGGVIALGMLEETVFFSEYNNINITGETNPGLAVFAELVLRVKRTLAHILVIIVSMGFGIVKPRLGSTLYRVLGVGALYFILATTEGFLKAVHPKSDPDRQQLIVTIPLAVLDGFILMWIDISLKQTRKTLHNWTELWIEEAFFNHFLFSIVLLVIMVLLRPTANNQRYAFTPNVDFWDDDEDDDKMTLSDAFDGMKNDNAKNTPEVIINGNSKRKH